MDYDDLVMMRSSNNSTGQAGVPRDFFLSCKTGPEVETKVKGSRFVGQAFRVDDLAAVETFLVGIRKKYYDATHHCTAYRLGSPDTSTEKSDDNGEPSGSAGVPILGAIHRANRYDCFIIVTRYYGGTKLGTGGLVRAYGEAARFAVEKAPERVIWHEIELTLRCSYDSLGAVEAVLGREATRLRGVERVFEATPEFRVRVARSFGTGLEDILVEATAGKIEIIGREERQDDS